MRLLGKTGGLVDTTAPSSDIGAIAAISKKFQLTQHAEYLSWAKYSVLSKSGTSAPASICLGDETRPGRVFDSMLPMAAARTKIE
jgi:hypothetical protein